MYQVIQQLMRQLVYYDFYTSFSNIDVPDVVKFQNIMSKILGDCKPRLNSDSRDGCQKIIQEDSWVIQYGDRDHHISKYAKTFP